MILHLNPPAAPGAADQTWPPEVDIILSALEAGRASARTIAESAARTSTGNRRRTTNSRVQHRIRAELRLFSDVPGTDPWILFTRDVDVKGIGFLSKRHIPLGQSGRVTWVDPKGHLREAHCSVCRCREAAQGWYEGAVAFH
jgi:hypothetical protein